MVHIYKTPQILRWLSPNLTWKVETDQKDIYLTFDDGPVPGLTEYVLEELKKYDASATFFCVGENMKKHAKICHKIIEDGHLLGNHTFNHLKGWSIKNHEYFMNIDQCQREIDKYQQTQFKPLFRPPYGQITKSQIHFIKEKYDIIMWDILTYDYEIKLAPLKRLYKIFTKTSSGTIIVFHDNYKGEKNLRFFLPRYLDYFRNQGFQFKNLGNL